MKPVKTNATSQAKQTKKELLEEIISLGGTAKDLDLVAGIDSDQDDAGNKPAGQGKRVDETELQDELSNFYKTLGFEKLVRKPASDTDDEVENGDHSLERENSAEEDSASSDDAAVDANLPPKSLAPNIKAAFPKPQKQGPPVSNAEWLVFPQQLWHTLQPPLLEPASASFALTPQHIEKMHERGKELLATLNTQYIESLSPTQHKRNFSKHNDDAHTISTLSKSDKAFISTIMQSGTSSDRLSALILLTSSSPLHCTSHLSQLLNLANKKSRDEATRSVRSLVDWLQNQGLPDRKLLWFADQNPEMLKRVAWAQSSSQLKRSSANAQNVRRLGDSHLAIWAFEDWLKKWYLDFLRALESLSQDPLPFVRSQMLPHIATLLSSKPEQEQNLLVLLTHKLGDGEKSVASKTSFLLLQLLQSHPMMKPIVVRELAASVLRPLPANAAKDVGLRAKHDHARYYGLITMNQVVLARKDAEVAGKMIDVYFEVFNDVLRNGGHETQTIQEKKEVPSTTLGKRKRGQNEAASAAHNEESDSKLIAAVLTGVKRAFPYAKLDEDSITARLDTLYRISHAGTFTVSMQALSLIQLITAEYENLSNRFYRVLYESILDARVAATSKYTMYLNLLFKAIQADPSPPRVAAFARRLLQVCTHNHVPFVMGVMHLLSQAFSTSASLQAMLTSKEPTQLSANGMEVQRSVDETYDPRKREPAFANATGLPLWELNLLLSHHHPSVVESARNLLSRHHAPTPPDLNAFNTARLLDRFAYRDARVAAAGKTKGVSAMQPAAAGQDRNGRVSIYGATLHADEPLMNSESFWRQPASKIAAHQTFFYTKFTQKHREQAGRTLKSLARSKRQVASDDDASVNVDDDMNEDPIISDIESLGSSDGAEDEIARAIADSIRNQHRDLSTDEDDVTDDSVAFEIDSNAIESGAGPDSDAASESRDASDSVNFVFDDEASEAENIPPSVGKKARKSKSLPAFAAAEDYAALLESD